VRPLLDDDSGDPSAVTRDYQLELDTDGAPLLSVWGGKITTFRKLAEEAADLLAKPLGERRPAWTEHALLPGGDLREWIGAPQRPDVDIERLQRALVAKHPELPAATLKRWARSYGSRVSLILDAQGAGAEVVPGVFEAELRYLHDHEWARSTGDVLWRRTKLGLHLGEADQAALAVWWQRRYGDAGSPSFQATTPMENAWS
jgi:glycerol-3-phosphate dehydrogenase